eukprot:GEMP01012219.1.p1 GENE.GEMP01012219.1~~GEMP01012219.1.p1  ORF type:complete len:465 (+),score=64.94 GEMP01012219.1:28-1422(+)
MVHMGDLRVLHRLNEVIVYLTNINEIKDNDRNTANGLKCAASSSTSYGATTSSNSDSKKLVCSGPLCIVGVTEGRALIVGPMNTAMFTYELPSVFCVLSRQEITCRGPTEGAVVVIQIVNPRLGDMDELVNVLSTCECVVHQPRYDDRVEWWAYRLRIAGQYIGWAIGKAGSLAALGIEKVGEVARKNLEPVVNVTEIHPEMRNAIAMTKQSCEALAQGVDYMTSHAVMAAKFVAENAAAGLNDAAVENPGVTKGKIIAESAVSASIEVWQAINDASDEVCISTTDATAKTVGHKYGEQAEAVTRDGLHVVVNVVQAVHMRTPAKFLQCAGELVAVGAGEVMLNPSGEEKSSESLNPMPKLEPLHIGRHSLEDLPVSERISAGTLPARSASEGQAQLSRITSSPSPLPQEKPIGIGTHGVEEVPVSEAIAGKKSPEHRRGCTGFCRRTRRRRSSARTRKSRVRA